VVCAIVNSAERGGLYPIEQMIDRSREQGQAKGARAGISSVSNLLTVVYLAQVIAEHRSIGATLSLVLLQLRISSVSLASDFSGAQLCPKSC